MKKGGGCFFALRVIPGVAVPFTVGMVLLFSVYCAIGGRRSWVKVDWWSRQKMGVSYTRLHQLRPRHQGERAKIKTNMFGVLDHDKNNT